MNELFLDDDEDFEHDPPRRERRREIRRRWNRSPWRIVPLPVLAFVVTGTYWWSVGKSDAWLHAFGPVLTVGTFTLVGPYIKNRWFRHQRSKLDHEEKRSKA